MNRDCYGDFFKAGGTWYYRCLLDGQVVACEDPHSKQCPLCERYIVGHHHGIVDVETVVVRRVTLKVAGRDTVLILSEEKQGD